MKPELAQTSAHRIKTFNKLSLAFCLSTTLAACGGGGNGGSVNEEGAYTPPAIDSATGSNPTPGSSTTSSAVYLKDENPYIKVLATSLSSGNDSSAVDTSAQNPLDIYPNDDGFTFHWEIESSVMLFSDNFLYLTANGQDVPLFSYYVNPVESTLNSFATCQYDNNNRLECFRQGSGFSWPTRTDTDMNPLFPELPVTYELKMAVCSLLNGCDHVRLGYVRFN